MHCPACGTELQQGTRFCSKCGAQALRPEQADAAPGKLELRINPTFERERRENNETLRIGLIVLAIMVGLLVVGIGVQRWMASRDQGFVTTGTSPAVSASTQEAAPIQQDALPSPNTAQPAAQAVLDAAMQPPAPPTSVTGVRVGVALDSSGNVKPLDFIPPRPNTLYAQVGLAGGDDATAAQANVGIEWKASSGQVLARNNSAVSVNGSGGTVFRLIGTENLPAGEYEADILLDNQLVQRRGFEIVAEAMQEPERDGAKDVSGASDESLQIVEQDSGSDVPPPPPKRSYTPNDLSANICSRPSTASLVRALMQSGANSADLSLRITFLADGTVTSASIAKSSQNRDLDRAAQSWARSVKVCPGAAGEGLLPLSFSTN